MTYETKMAQVRALIEAYNASAAAKIDFAAFEKKLQALGACTDGTLAKVSWEDLQECGLPKLLARQVAEELRGPSAKDDFVSQKKVDRMRYEELIERYEPREDNAIARKLKELSGGKRFIVFLDTGTLDPVSTLRLLVELRRGYSEVGITTNSKGMPAQVYKVGEVPNDELDENPLYPGRALRTDETCDQTLRSWKGVSLQARQLVYLALTSTHEVSVKSISEAHDLLDLLVAHDAAWLTLRWVKAGLLYAELSAKNQLPRLKVKLSHDAGGGNHPFFISTAQGPSATSGGSGGFTNFNT